MKNKTSHVAKILMSIAMVALFFSCHKDEKPQKENSIKDTISTKWIITDRDSRYSSFEFTKDGNYIITKNTDIVNTQRLVSKPTFSSLKKNISSSKAKRYGAESKLSPIHFGTYKIEGNKIILSGFGLIDIISITKEEFSFSFTLESTGEKDDFIAVKTNKSISPSKKTDMLCKTWVIKTVDIDFNKFSEGEIIYYKIKYGEKWQENYKKEWLNKTKGSVVLFSKAGTYLILYKEKIERDAGLSEWKWADEKQNSFYYSWLNWENKGMASIKALDEEQLVVEENETTTYLIIKK